MSQLQEFFKFLMTQCNTKDDLKKQLADWVGPYHGKILQVHTEEGPSYMVVTKDKIEIFDGIYPSPDVIYKSNAETLLAIFTGEKADRDAMKDGSLEVIGNAHESIPLANLILAVMMGAM